MKRLIPPILLLASCGQQAENERVAKATEKNCIEHGGFGRWSKASGETLAEFCKKVGIIQADSEAKH